MGRRRTRPAGRAEAPARLDDDARACRRRQVAGTVARPVVDDDDLVGAAQQTGDDPADDLRLVESRKDDRHGLGHPIATGRRRGAAVSDEGALEIGDADRRCSRCRARAGSCREECRRRGARSHRDSRCEPSRVVAARLSTPPSVVSLRIRRSERTTPAGSVLASDSRTSRGRSSRRASTRRVDDPDATAARGWATSVTAGCSASAARRRSARSRSGARPAGRRVFSPRSRSDAAAGSSAAPSQSARPGDTRNERTASRPRHPAVTSE